MHMFRLSSLIVQLPHPFHQYLCNLNPYDYKTTIATTTTKLVLSPFGEVDLRLVLPCPCLVASQINPFLASYLMCQWLALLSIEQMKLGLITTLFIIVPKWKYSKSLYLKFGLKKIVLYTTMNTDQLLSYLITDEYHHHNI